MKNEFKKGDKVQWSVESSDGKTKTLIQRDGVVIGPTEKKKNNVDVDVGGKVKSIRIKTLRSVPVAS